MKKYLHILLVLCSTSTYAQNLILNGGFEVNNVQPVGTCRVDMSNSNYTSLMSNSTAFSEYGPIENGIFFDSCTNYNGLITNNITYQGGYSVYLVSIDTIISNFHYQQYTAYSLALFQPLQVGTFYKLVYYHKIIPHIYISNFLAGKLLIGISDSDTSFGSIIDTMNRPTNEWDKVEITFQATIPAQHLTMKGMLEQGLHGALVDSFVLTLDSVPPNAIYEQQGKKKLLKIVDVLGKKSSPNKKGLLFYIYSDGTVEKRIVVE